ncbi:MAG: ferrous iron transporter B [Balneolaceae bacterium]|nr:ferrous iron transporter B [Balneolaceae bacterium]
MNQEARIEDVLEKAHRFKSEIGQSVHDQYVERLFQEAASISKESVTKTPIRYLKDEKIDRILTSKLWGFPTMIGLFTLVIWLTIEGANVPSSMLATFFLDWLYPILKEGTDAWPWWLSGLLIDGMYLATAWVISVMLPPMAIFFPMFTLLEDLGYLPRVAFNLDGLFKKAGAHGKQALSMMMGFGCNAAGVISTRIIDSPRERLIAIITNNFSLCNGRWPTIIILSSLFVGALAPAWFAGFATALSVVAIALLGVALTFLASWMLSKSVLKGEASAFSLELPPYRPPKIMQTLYTSIIDRTIFVLWRAIIFALPAGAAIWLSSNIMVGDISVAEYIINSLDPIGWVIGLNGVILLAYIVAIPANEIIIPTILMLTVLTTGMTGVGSGAGVMFEPEDMSTLSNVLQAGGWTLLTAISVMLFSLMHNPCSTTIYTIYKETKSVKWTVMATLLPYGFGITILIVLAAVWRAFA